MNMETESVLEDKERDTTHHPVVMVVDDDKEVLFSLNLWLGGKGFVVFTASDETEARQILESEPVEVALLDFKLGNENGLDVALKLKEADENLKIIILTGYPSYDTAVESIKSGLFDYLDKSNEDDKILDAINKALLARHKEMIEKGEIAFNPNVIKFAVLCKHSLIKERLRTFTINFPDFKLIDSFNSLKHLVERKYLPEIHIVMVCATCCIPTFEDAFLFLNDLYRVLPNVKPVLFNDYFSKKEKVELIKSGVKGFFSVDMSSDKLEKALTLIKKGEIWSSRRLVNLAIPSGPEYLKERLQDVDTYGLSSREKDILKAMVLGLKNKEIGEKLFISEMTVKSHINRIFKKFEVNNRAKAIRFAMEKKLI